jgi:hypothetical protein
MTDPTKVVPIESGSDSPKVPDDDPAITNLLRWNQEKAERIASLRSILIACGRNAGCFLADEVSDGFLAHVPEEIKAKLAALNQELVVRTVQRDAWINYAFHGHMVPALPEAMQKDIDRQGLKRNPTAIEELKAEVARLKQPVSEDRLKWLAEHEADLITHRQKSADGGWWIWWNVVKRGRSISGHPLGSPEAAIDAAILAARSTGTPPTEPPPAVPAQ